MYMSVSGWFLWMEINQCTSMKNNSILYLISFFLPCQSCLCTCVFLVGFCGWKLTIVHTRRLTVFNTIFVSFLPARVAYVHVCFWLVSVDGN